jgi:hypothetical protein
MAFHSLLTSAKPQKENALTVVEVAEIADTVRA